MTSSGSRFPVGFVRHAREVGLLSPKAIQRLLREAMRPRTALPCSSQ